ncbi:MAG: hypothetical protein IPH69_05295 [Bacteroidales bacterium]|nr:hypothetical protein [Bacteroidales bacterium]MBK7627192.1 hypothetical protein [Bacteroidales bacterium]
MNKKVYIIPEILKIDLDNTISLQMASQPEDPPPLGGSKGGSSEPFQSPFGDKPFS